MFVSGPPKLAISDLVRKMKGRSSHKVQREFPELRRRYWGRRFWGRGYFSTTNGAITEDIVLQYLEQHIADPTGAVVVQYFTGETFFQHKLPIHPSSLRRWRDRICEEGAEWLLTKTIEAGRSAGVIDDDRLSRVSVETTVMEKNIAHPTDVRLYEKARAKDLGIDLRQTYARKAPRLAQQIGR